MSLKFIIYLLCVCMAGSHPDYCLDNYYCYGRPHVGCNNPIWTAGTFGSTCRQPSFIPNTAAVKQAFLNRFNTLRSQTGLGKTPNYSAANHMATLTWDQDLADLAVLNCKSCVFAHEKCQNTVKWKWSGQTIALQYVDINSNYSSDTFYATNAVNLWFAEAAQNGARYGWMNIIKNYTATDPNYEIGHFCQVVRDVNMVIGCGSTKYVTNVGGTDWKAVQTTCNYGQIVPFVGHNVYVAGTTAAKCKTGKNTQYPGLCSLNETCPYAAA